VRALVLQHIACEPPGVYEDVLRERGATIHPVELDEGEPLPDWRELDVIVAMGGPMSVNDETENPWPSNSDALGLVPARDEPDERRRGYDHDEDA
jgi:GMP synthase-like glutamine amidotransferase